MDALGKQSSQAQGEGPRREPEKESEGKANHSESLKAVADASALSEQANSSPPASSFSPSHQALGSLQADSSTTNPEDSSENRTAPSQETRSPSFPAQDPSRNKEDEAGSTRAKDLFSLPLRPKLWATRARNEFHEQLQHLKPHARHTLAQVLHHSGARKAISRLRRHQAGGRRVVVLGYHRVCSDFESDQAGCIPSCLIGQDTFRQHVEFLQEHFELVNMSQALDVLMGRDKLPPNRDVAAITFDDGYRDLVDHALPVLSQLGAPATVYVSSGVISEGGWFPHDQLYSLLCDWNESARTRALCSGWANAQINEAKKSTGSQVRFWLGHLIRHCSPEVLDELRSELSSATAALPLPPPSARALDWEGLMQLKEGGFEIGAHTVGHRVLPHLSEEEILRELLESKSALEAVVGEPVRHFAYCNGYYDPRVIRALQRSGYVSAVTTEDRLNRHGQDPYRIARRVLWEGSARGPGNKQSAALLACQLDGTWASLGLSRPEPGELLVPQSSSEPGVQRVRTSA